MRFVCLQVVFVACIATITAQSITDLVRGEEPRVRIYRKNALLPCTCADGVLDCSERSKFSLSAADRCPGTVTAVNLNNNELAAFPDGLLQATTANISGNQLTSLPLLSQLNPQLRHLDLSENEINTTGNGLGSLGNLETLIVSKNDQLRSLRFLPLPCGLRHLHAREINLRDIGSPLTQCILLETLDLSYNSLTILPEDTFSAFSHLRVLDLGKNNLEPVTSQLFNSLTQLRSLRLYYNKLRTLPSGLFNSLSNLENLDLQGNLFTSLPSGLFSPLSKLTHLNITAIPFAAFPTEISNLPALEELQLAANGITSFPENSFSSLTHLEELHLIYNEMPSLPNNIFSGLTNLKIVTLGFTPLSTLPSDIFSGVTKVNFVWLPCVGLTADNLRLVRNVTSLLYGVCEAFELPSGVLSVVSRAEHLVIRSTNITSIAEDAFHGLPLLKMLHLSDDAITALPVGVFSQLSNLQRLYLKNNKISAIPEGLFSGLTNLQFVNLAKNQFPTLPENLFQGLRSLESVDLSMNPLTSLPPNLFAGLPSLKEVNLEITRMASLPAYGPGWATLPALAFGLSENLRVDAASLRPWLAEGARYLSLDDTTSDEALPPQSVAWLLEEPGVRLTAGSPRGCNCGMARRGGVLLHLCVAMRCEGRPRHADDWLLAAVRQANVSAGARGA